MTVRDPSFPQAHARADEDGTVHYWLDNAIGGGQGPASWTSEHDCNPVCGCHLASKCLGLQGLHVPRRLLLRRGRTVMSLREAEKADAAKAAVTLARFASNVLGSAGEVPGATTAESACRAREVAVVTIGGHANAVSLIATACVHEHVSTEIPACQPCLDRHARESLCCAECELSAPRGTSHCCPLTITARQFAGDPEGRSS